MPDTEDDNATLSLRRSEKVQTHNITTIDTS